MERDYELLLNLTMAANPRLLEFEPETILIGLSNPQVQVRMTLIAAIAIGGEQVLFSLPKKPWLLECTIKWRCFYFGSHFAFNRCFENWVEHYLVLEVLSCKCVCFRYHIVFTDFGFE